MTSQQRADELLRQWQLQRAAGIAANDRLPLTPSEAFERDLEAIRSVMERAQ